MLTTQTVSHRRLGGAVEQPTRLESSPTPQVPTSLTRRRLRDQASRNRAAIATAQSPMVTSGVAQECLAAEFSVTSERCHCRNRVLSAEMLYKHDVPWPDTGLVVLDRQQVVREFDYAQLWARVLCCAAPQQLHRAAHNPMATTLDITSQYCWGARERAVFRRNRDVVAYLHRRLNRPWRTRGT